MKKTSIHQLYWSTTVGHIFMLICSIVTSIIITINYNGFIESIGKVFGIIFLICVNGLLVASIFFVMKEIVILLKDFKSLKNNDYISIIGKVMKFKRNIDPDSGVQTNNKPTVLILDTSEEVELIINDKIMIYKYTNLII